MFLSLTGNSRSLSLYPPRSLEQLGCNTIPREMWFSSSKGSRKTGGLLTLPVVVAIASICDDGESQVLAQAGLVRSTSELHAQSQ